MEKVVLSSGYEFDIVPNGYRVEKNSVTFTFLPLEYTVEQLMGFWNNLSAITVKNGETSIRVFSNYSKCDSMTRVTNYLLENKYYCPECHTEVEPTATTCPSCNAAFEDPTMEEVRVVVCKVTCEIPDVNDRLADAEDAIEDIINSIFE